MKKFIYISLGLLFVLTISIILLNMKNPHVKVENEQEILSHFNNNETFVLVIGASTCHYCKDYKANTLVQYLKDPIIPLHFIYNDTSFPNSTEFQSFVSQYNISYENSPTSYIVKNGQVIAKQEGDISLQDLNTFINNNIQ